ncbi:fibrillarin-like pre-rRNA processing protein [Halohasta litchfieldiae]|jgi:fibrillarin-like pre-rRNA processing protein|uniref:Fibrillarin-like rRNA/tRNA 2'-O-methyltransferase n=1 Tax=Halohasta litchfieldiae TaxID=1073996 RepID=A0A1H6RRP6_9EURY|nr:fibrillarin-like rRNA/tRNA 2'-O-methyltransferase [Halohasta litchfieldiae]ATW89689.1 fibrillarin-like pre-rRNA processing protein [Halohasta litchfieldiae]SEI54215.1 rRNA 2'-O-methyltransferase fibrillarin [Halohasta litchfieldiae]
MTELPDGVERRNFDGQQRLSTQGTPVYGEPTDGDWRLWDAGRSKLGAMLESGMAVDLSGVDSVLYLGAASGTTVSHVADFAGPTYAIEFAPRPVRDLIGVAEDRSNLFPLLKDARKPESYAHIVESDLDLLVQDVATRGQAAVAVDNAQFLADDGLLCLAIKARSEDVTADPETVFRRVREELASAYEIVDSERLEPFHADHLGIVARKR